MADWPPVIDADGHVLERQSDIRKYLEPPWDRRNTGLWPSDQPFDTDLFDTLGCHAPSAQHVCEKRPNILRTLGTAKGDEQHCVERI